MSTAIVYHENFYVNFTHNKYLVIRLQNINVKKWLILTNLPLNAGLPTHNDARTTAKNVSILRPFCSSVTAPRKPSDMRTASLVTSRKPSDTRTASLVTSRKPSDTRTASLVTSRKPSDTRTASLVTPRKPSDTRTASLVTSRKLLRPIKTAQLSLHLDPGLCHCINMFRDLARPSQESR